MAQKYATRENFIENINIDYTNTSKDTNKFDDAFSKVYEKICNENSGVLIALNDYKKYELYLHTGNGYLLLLFTNENGIREMNFNDLKNHLKINKNLKNFLSDNINNSKYLIRAKECTIYKVNIINNINESSSYLDTLEYNLKQMANLKPGDRVDFNRSWYTHSAIFVDRKNFKIIHRNGEPGNTTSTFDLMNKALVVEENLIDIMELSKFYCNNSLDEKYPPRPPHKILEYARERVGEKGYNLLTKNCQHFAAECRNDYSESHEVNRGITITGAILGISTAIAGFFIYKNRNNTENEEENKNKNKRNELQKQI